MEFVVKSFRMKNYLYSLGFNFRQVSDKTEGQEFVYLFPNNDDLQEALKFYTKYHKKNLNQQKK